MPFGLTSSVSVLYPGVRVTETELADQFGVNRTPVREALQRRAVEGYVTEGYVTIRAKQGCFGRDLDIEEINQYQEVRIGLELRVRDLPGRADAARELNRLAAIWTPARIPWRAAGGGGHGGPGTRAFIWRWQQRPATPR